MCANLLPALKVNHSTLGRCYPPKDQWKVPKPIEPSPYRLSNCACLYNYYRCPPGTPTIQIYPPNPSALVVHVGALVGPGLLPDPPGCLPSAHAAAAPVPGPRGAGLVPRTGQVQSAQSWKTHLGRFEWTQVLDICLSHSYILHHFIKTAQSRRCGRVVVLPICEKEITVN